MADDIAITAGSGTTVATDDIGGRHFQRTKIVWGTDGTATDASASNPLPTVQTGALPAGTNNIGDVDVLSTVLPVPASTGTVTSVNDTASSTTLLSSSSSRRGFRIFNDSPQTLYVKYGATASATDFTCRVDPGGYLEEDRYYGRVDGIWAADAGGAARITELT